MAGTLKFNYSDVARIVAAVLVHQSKDGEFSPAYGGEAEPGLFLVGDHGVYLMGNQKGIELKEGERHDVVYAQGINPDVDEFDVWWGNKEVIFGGDDGAELIPIDMIKDWLKRNEGKKTVSVRLSSRSIRFV